MRAFLLQFPYGDGYHPDYNAKASQNDCVNLLLSLFKECTTCLSGVELSLVLCGES